MKPKRAWGPRRSRPNSQGVESSRTRRASLRSGSLAQPLNAAAGTIGVALLWLEEHHEREAGGADSSSPASRLNAATAKATMFSRRSADPVRT